MFGAFLLSCRTELARSAVSGGAPVVVRSSGRRNRSPEITASILRGGISPARASNRHFNLYAKHRRKREPPCTEDKHDASLMSPQAVKVPPNTACLKIATLIPIIQTNLLGWSE